MTNNMLEKLKQIRGNGMIKDVLKKLKGIGVDSLTNVQEMLKEIGANSMIKQVHEKLNDSGVDSLMTNVQDKLNDILGRKSMIKEEHEKLTETVGAKSLMKGAKYLPCAPVFIIFIVLMLCFFLSGIYWGRRKATKMVKSPGRNYKLPRHVFESDPRSYFRSNKSKKAH